MRGLPLFGRRDADAGMGPAQHRHGADAHPRRLAPHRAGKGHGAQDTRHAAAGCGCGGVLSLDGAGLVGAGQPADGGVDACAAGGADRGGRDDGLPQAPRGRGSGRPPPRIRRPAAGLGPGDEGTPGGDGASGITMEPPRRMSGAGRIALMEQMKVQGGL